MRLQFSGHETFACKQYWLKKGYDFIEEGNRFGDDTAVVKLGVGKNMVTSIRFYTKAFGLVEDSESLGKLASYIFSNDKGVDPFLEDLASLYLWQYQIVKEQKASLYYLVFNELKSERQEFTASQLNRFIVRKIEELGQKIPSKKTIESDISVFIRNYVAPQRATGNIEEDFNGVLQELGLISAFDKLNLQGKKQVWYKLNLDTTGENLPYQVFLYIVLDNPYYGTTISLRDLIAGPNSPGNTFLLTEQAIRNKIEEIVAHYPQISFSETAGNPVLQINQAPYKWDILSDYYNG
jgi:hypothetical protein